MTQKKNTARFLKILISLIIVAVFFYAGFRAGLFLFKKIEKDKINAAAISAASQIATSTQSPISVPEAAFKNYCRSDAEFFDISDKKFCSEQSRVGVEKSLEINLTASKAVLYENGEIKSIYPLAYQSQEGRWYQAPTGYYFAGQKEKKIGRASCRERV